ncbi:methyltransferase FkbM [Thermocrinis albus DSM 14484]|uniref:Methyltransferase FkbM n=1 Tax=Thermocrinis albus (strain DSM 14484 / JCM 11386 / HI 11/12) TaxID=638303 RepID=D3SNN6_THEAH|nr:hypothetical protein [Thermocrinis albus]ADC88773.1 methyltransferase FkbM [Thermocrinis albus DSM 14484]
MSRFERPVLFITFKRLDTTRRVLEAIKKIKPKRLYIASDGGRTEEEHEKVLKVREFIVNSIDWDCSVKTRFRDRNLGVGFGPNDAISWFFSEEEAGIILEDDCLPSVSFFRFCDELLDMYKDNKRIGVIQGFNPFPRKDYPYSYFFSKYDLKWGWATWRDRWQYQDMYTSDWPQVKNTDFLDRISQGNKMVKLYWEAIFDEIHKYPHLAWDTQFTYQMLKRGMLAVVPKKNIVLNIGYHAEATPTKWGIPKHIRALSLEELEFPLSHPEEIKVNFEYDRLVETVHFEMNIKTVFRLKLKRKLDENKLLRTTILPVLVKIYRGYKSLKT